MIRIGILHIRNQELAKLLPVEDIDTHGSQIALGLFRFFLKFVDHAVFIGIHDTEAAGFPHGHFDHGDGSIRLVFFMVVQHLGIIHLIDVVSGKRSEGASCRERV